MSDYLSVVYSEAKRPRTAYPARLAAYLVRRFDLGPGVRLLEAGCGRGEFLRGFRDGGLTVCGLDGCPQALETSPDLPISLADVESGPLPFAAESFDVVFSKSFIEHLFHPDRFFREAWRVLRPGGRLITMVPDWESCMRVYFDDFTHRTPFSRVSLADLYQLCDFADVRVERFRQLPQVWDRPWLGRLCACIAPLVPARTKVPFLRWSRELMVLGCGVKAPAAEDRP